MCHVSFLSFFGTIDVKNDLHICIVLFEVSRAIFSTYFLYYVVMMLWYVLTLFEKKKHLSIQAWVRVMLVSVCKYHPLVLSLLSLFLTCDISLGYMEKQREEKKNLKKKKLNKTNTPVIWCLLWSLADVVTRLRATERGCTASRLKGWGNIFVTECKSYSEGGKRDELWGHRFISLECKQKRRKIIKYIFVKLKCKYPHLQELECWSYLLSRHGILLYVIYMQFIILWLSLFCICVC